MQKIIHPQGDCPLPTTIPFHPNSIVDLDSKDPGSLQAELQGQGADEEDSDTEKGRRRKSARHTSLLEDLGPLCTPQSKLMNSFGNIIINTGNNSIVGGDGLPCMNVSPEAAKLIGYWDYEACF